MEERRLGPAGRQHRHALLPVGNPLHRPGPGHGHLGDARAAGHRHRLRPRPPAGDLDPGPAGPDPGHTHSHRRPHRRRRSPDGRPTQALQHPGREPRHHRRRRRTGPRRRPRGRHVGLRRQGRARYGPGAQKLARHPRNEPGTGRRDRHLHRTRRRPNRSGLGPARRRPALERTRPPAPPGAHRVRRPVHVLRLHHLARRDGHIQPDGAARHPDAPPGDNGGRPDRHRRVPHPETGIPGTGVAAAHSRQRAADAALDTTGPSCSRRPKTNAKRRTGRKPTPKRRSYTCLSNPPIFHTPPETHRWISPTSTSIPNTACSTASAASPSWCSTPRTWR